MRPERDTEDENTTESQLKATAAADEGERSGCRPPLWLVLLMLVVLVVAGVLALQVFGVLYGLVFPPEAPRPDGVTTLSHENRAYQVDEWRYRVSGSPCDVLGYYRSQGGQCTVQAGSCGAEGSYTPPVYEADYFARCTHVEPFAIFALRWEATIDPIYAPNPTETTFTLFSEVLWGGPPPETSGGIPLTPGP